MKFMIYSQSRWLTHSYPPMYSARLCNLTVAVLLATVFATILLVWSCARGGPLSLSSRRFFLRRIVAIVCLVVFLLALVFGLPFIGWQQVGVLYDHWVPELERAKSLLDRGLKAGWGARETRNPIGFGYAGRCGDDRIQYGLEVMWLYPKRKAEYTASRWTREPGGKESWSAVHGRDFRELDVAEIEALYESDDKVAFLKTLMAEQERKWRAEIRRTR